MPEQMKMLQKQEAVEEKEQGEAESSNSALTPASCTAHHFTKEAGTHQALRAVETRRVERL